MLLNIYGSFDSCCGEDGKKQLRRYKRRVKGITIAERAPNRLNFSVGPRYYLGFRKRFQTAQEPKPSNPGSLRKKKWQTKDCDLVCR